MKRLLILVTFALAAAACAAPPTAQEVVRQAQVKAAKEHKNVLVIFSASWRQWCRRFDALFASPEFKQPFEDSYVIAKITVRERDELRKNENAGWEKLMFELRGTAERDVPFLAVLSPKGELLKKSYRAPAGGIPSNAGWPRRDSEIEAFMDLIRRTGRAFTPQQRLALRALFRRDDSG